MSSPKKDIMKLSEQGVITGEALLAYLHNKLSVADKLEFERLLAEDEFAREALEGMKEVQSAVAIPNAISAVNRKVRERVGLKERKTLTLHWTNYAWAAAILGLLLAVGFLMVFFIGRKTPGPVANQVDNTSPAQTVAPAKTEPPAAVSDTAITAQVTAPVAAATNKDSSKSNLAKPVVTVSPQGAVAASGSIAANKPAPPAVKQSDNFASGSSIQAVNAGTGQVNSKPAASTPSGPSQGLYTNSSLTATSNNNVSGQPSVTTNQWQMAKNNADSVQPQAMFKAKAEAQARPATPAMAEKRTAEVESITVEDAMKSFDQSDYKKSAELFDKILKHEPDNAQALYFGGISDYINGNTTKSEANFDKLMKKGALYADGARWYKANILLKKGEREKAKSLLQDLANSNGSYKERAVKKLSDEGL